MGRVHKNFISFNVTSLIFQFCSPLWRDNSYSIKNPKEKIVLLIVTLTFTKEQKRCQLTEQKKKALSKKVASFYII